MSKALSDSPLYGTSSGDLPPCSIQTIPVPWDPIFQARWTAFIRAFGQRYDSNPTVTQVKLTGINYETEEHSLPHSVKASINGGKCKSYNDVANWQSIGYTRVKVMDAWGQIANAYHDFFPHKPFAAQLVPGGFPPIDSNGAIIARQSVDYQVTTDILNAGMTEYRLPIRRPEQRPVGNLDLVAIGKRRHADPDGLSDRPYHGRRSSGGD